MPQPKSAHAKTDVHLVPIVQGMLAFGAVSIAMTVVVAAIFGTPEQSARAFRLFKGLGAFLRPRNA